MIFVLMGHAVLTYDPQYLRAPIITQSLRQGSIVMQVKISWRLRKKPVREIGALPEARPKVSRLVGLGGTNEKSSYTLHKLALRH